MHKTFPKELVILPGANKFPIAPKWQNKRKTPKRGWPAAQMILLCGKVSGVTCVDIDDDVDFWEKLCFKY